MEEPLDLSLRRHSSFTPSSNYLLNNPKESSSPATRISHNMHHSHYNQHDQHGHSVEKTQRSYPQNTQKSRKESNNNAMFSPYSSSSNNGNNRDHEEDEQHLDGDSDTVKTYCDEGTPRNFSVSNSCNDLTKRGLSPIEERPLTFCQEGTPQGAMLSRFSSLSSIGCMTENDGNHGMVSHMTNYCMHNN